MTKLVCLHLSDLHIGDPRFDSAWVNVGPTFFEDVSRLRKENDQLIDVIAFTGDLVFSGTREQFDKLDQLIERLFTDLPLAKQCRLLPVPGNHDLQRFEQKIDHVGDNLCERWKVYQEDFWLGNDPESLTYIENRFKQFSDWQKRSTKLLLEPTRHGMIPGDATYTIKKDGVCFGFMSLNTAFLQFREGHFKEKLDLSNAQYVKAAQEETAAWNTAHLFSVLLTHHPLDWLQPEAKRAFVEEIRHNFTCHLYGHMHEPTSIAQSIDGGADQYSFQAASIAGIDRVEGITRREHGYGIFEFEADTTGPQSIKYWSRKYDVQGNKRQFVANKKLKLTEENNYLEFCLSTTSVKDPVSQATTVKPPTVASNRTPVFGRDDEIIKIVHSIESNSIVCLKGIGGVGKTAIAKEVVAQVTRAHLWIEVNSIDPENASALVDKILEQFSQPVDLDANKSIHQVTGFAQLVELIPINQLLVLDGFSLISQDVSKLLVQLTRRRDDIRILTTSWGQIHSIDAPIFDIQPLAIFEAEARVESMLESPAVKMFIAEVIRHRDNFVLDDTNIHDVVDLVGYTGGVPLAIKLIAATSRRRPLAVIKKQLLRGDKLIVNVADLDEHQQSLDKCFDRCFRLLTEESKQLLYGLSAFQASFPLSHVEFFGASPCLDELLDSSFIEFDDFRYSIHRLLKDYAREQATKVGFRLSDDLLVNLAGKFLLTQEHQEHTRDERELGYEIQDTVQAENFSESSTPDDWQNALVVLDLLLKNDATKYHASRLIHPINRWLRSTSQWRIRLEISKRTLTVLEAEERRPQPHSYSISNMWLRFAILECLEHAPATRPKRLFSEYMEFIVAVEKLQQSGALPPKQHENLTLAKVAALHKLAGINQTAEQMKPADLVKVAEDFLAQQKSPSVRARLLSVLGALHQNAGATEAAAAAFRDALANSNLGPFQIAHCRENLAKIYLSKGELLEAAREFGYNASSDRADIAAKALGQQADAMSRSGSNPERTVDLFHQSIAIRSRAGDSKGVGITKSLLSNHYKRTNQAAKAMAEINESISLLSKYHSPELARAYMNRALLQTKGLAFAGALSDNLQAYRILEGSQHVDRLIAADRVAMTYQSANDIEQAGQWFSKTVALLSEKCFRKADRRYACLNADRFAFRYQANHSAVAFKQQLEEQARKLGITDFLESLPEDLSKSSYENQAFRIRLVGRRLREESSWSELIELYADLIDKWEPTKPIRKAIFLNELGSAYRNRRDFELCISCERQALAIFETAELNAGVADAHHKLGDAFLEYSKDVSSSEKQTKVYEAISHYKKSIEIKMNMQPIENTGLRISLAGLADAYHTRGDHKDAYLVYVEALKLTDIKGRGKGLLRSSVEAFMREHAEYRPKLEPLLSACRT